MAFVEVLRKFHVYFKEVQRLFQERGILTVFQGNFKTQEVREYIILKVFKVCFQDFSKESLMGISMHVLRRVQG